MVGRSGTDGVESAWRRLLFLQKGILEARRNTIGIDRKLAVRVSDHTMAAVVTPRSVDRKEYCSEAFRDGLYVRLVFFSSCILYTLLHPVVWLSAAD